MLYQKQHFTLSALLRFAALLSLMVLLGACNLASDGGDDQQETPIIAPTLPSSGAPVVQIITPQNNAQFNVNDAVLVNVSVTNARGVTQVTMSVNGQIVQRRSPEPGTDPETKTFLMDYTPRSPGTLNVRVEAFRGNVVSAPAEITLTVLPANQPTATLRPGTNPTANPNPIPTVNQNDPTCRAQTRTGLNMRRGPGTNFSVITTLAGGAIVPVVGRLPDNSWYQVTFGASVGWINGSTEFVTLYGSRCVNVPIVQQATNPPPPTPFPTLTPLPAQPNLVVTNIVGPREVVIPIGQTSVTVQYAMTITNNGGPVTTQFTNLVLAIPGSQTFEAGIVGNLGAGQSINLSNINVTFSTPGTYILQFTADSNNQVVESNDFDNAATSNVVVTSAGPR
jgi:hypothetical protein